MKFGISSPQVYSTATSLLKTLHRHYIRKHHTNTTLQPALTIGFALENLGGDVAGGAALAGDRETLGVGRKAKVSQLDVRVVALAGQQQVLGLQVSVRGWWEMHLCE